MIGISVIVSTRNRAASLRALLASLEHLDPPPLPYEIIVADNDSDDETPKILAEWRAISPEGRIVIEVTKHGKCHAVNRALSVARGELIVFLDHDVVVDQHHLVEVVDFFRARDCWAAQGAIGWPADTPKEILELTRRFGGIPCFEGKNGESLKELIGANMAIRRKTLERVGLFDEQLGPGMVGYCEDGEMAKRIVAHGGWIGAMPGARVIHEVDPARLTGEFHREMRRKAGASSYIQKPRRLYTWIIPKLLVAGVRWCVCRNFCGSMRGIRMAGRWYHYQGMLEMAMKENAHVIGRRCLDWLAGTG